MSDIGDDDYYDDDNDEQNDGDDGIDVFLFFLFILPAYEVRRTADKTAVFEVISGSPGRVLLGVGLCVAVAE